jgi:hypothetical protein
MAARIRCEDTHYSRGYWGARGARTRITGGARTRITVEATSNSTCAANRSLRYWRSSLRRGNARGAHPYPGPPYMSLMSIRSPATRRTRMYSLVTSES